MWNYDSDVLVQVLIRLPVKWVGRCKCVSRSWKVLISSSEFIGFHLQYQYRIQQKLKTIHLSHHGDKAYLVEYSINNNGIGAGVSDLESLEVGCEIQPVYSCYEDPAASNGRRSMLVGSSNGLICQILYDDDISKRYCVYGGYELSLCNPITKSTWLLPESPSYLEYERRRRVVVFFGFGYDDVHDTYKVFVANGPRHDEYVWRFNAPEQPDARYEYEVYSLRSNKWTVVSCLDNHDFHDYYIHSPRWVSDGVLINRALHWIITNPYGPNKNKEKYYILTFDLIADQLKILAPFPEAADDVYFSNAFLLSVMNGCLLLTNTTIRCEPEEIVDMWMMKEYGLKDSWTRIRIYNSPYRLCTITPLALLEVEEDNTNNNNNNHHHHRILVYSDCSFNRSDRMMLLSYDIDSHQVVELPPPPPPSSALSFFTPRQVQFVASLVQPRPTDLANHKIIHE